MADLSSTISLPNWVSGTTVTATGTQTLSAPPECTESNAVDIGIGDVSGCSFTNSGPVDPYRQCCGDSPLILYDGGCQLFCAKPAGPETDQLYDCLLAINPRLASVGCSYTNPVNATTTITTTTSSAPTTTTPSPTTATGAAAGLRVSVPKGYMNQGMLVAGLLAMSLLTGLWP